MLRHVAYGAVQCQQCSLGVQPAVAGNVEEMFARSANAVAAVDFSFLGCGHFFPKVCCLSFLEMWNECMRAVATTLRRLHLWC